MTTTTSSALAGTYVADREHSSFQAGVRHMGVGQFRAAFEDVRARLITDASGQLHLEGRALVESINIRTPAEFRAHVVESDDFFAAAEHPEITFASDDVRLTDDGRAEVRGELTIKGLMRAVLARDTHRGPVEDIYGGQRMALDLEATIDRRDFDMGWQAQLPRGGDVVSWDVALFIHLELVREDR